MTDPVAYRFENVADFDKNGTMDDLIVHLEDGKASYEPVYFNTDTTAHRQKINQGLSADTVKRALSFAREFTVDFSLIDPQQGGYAEQGVDASDDHAYVLGVMGDIYGKGEPEVLLILDPDATTPVVQHVKPRPGVKPEEAGMDDFVTVNAPSPSMKNETAPNGTVTRVITLN
jgi:hypothetical protein